MLPLAALALGWSLPAASRCHRTSGRCGCVSRGAGDLVRAAAPPDEASLARSLLREVREEERSLTAIANLVVALAALPPPPKPKRMLEGDWRLAFAGDETAVEALTTGAGAGTFSVVEQAFLRFLKAKQLKLIEVTRRYGPFNNEKRLLEGSFEVEKAQRAAAALRFSYRGYMLNPKGRETALPDVHKGRKYTADVVYLGATLAVARFTGIDAAAADSSMPTPRGSDPLDLSGLAVLERVDDLRDRLEELQVGVTEKKK